MAAAEAGKHILVEKPLATTVEDAEAIVNAANKAQVKLMVDFHNRANAPFINAKNSIEQGVLGKPAYIYARLSNTVVVATEMLPWAARSSALWFLASHTVDLAHWLLDDEPRRVYAVSRSGVLREMGVDTDDFHTAIVEFEQGAVATLENSWILPKTAPNVFDMKFEVTGSKGMLQINTSDHRAMQMYTDEEPSLPDVFGITFDESPRIRGFVLESIARFVDAVVNDGPVLASGEDGLLVTRVLVAITESAESGKPVEL